MLGGEQQLAWLLGARQRALVQTRVTLVFSSLRAPMAASSPSLNERTPSTNTRYGQRSGQRSLRQRSRAQ